ncbi:restriction endonuclease subunit S [Halomonas vilamensis]|uniref:Restriction endonuclease subunit S n=1 Tax=Vreelandella vilamensis TaxID=531309 RepID=A0ABU1H8J2_9GAMM|nr:restriction endonuclease subunit S [Halomonas vilamensis]MDR5899982.1 restriction endonuclease subunit S [Halomonas vilamensis]
MSYPAYPEYKDSGVEWLAEVPAHWGLKKFRYLFQESGEKIEDEVVGEMLSVSGYRGIEVKKYEDENKKRTDSELSGYRIVRPSQLVVNTMWLNYAGLGVSNYEGHVSPAYRSYWINSHLNKRFIHHLMRSESYVKGYTKYLTGIRPNSLQMSRDDLMSFPVLIPSRYEQDAIASFLDHETARIDALVDEQQRLVELLKEKRQAVISHAVTKGLDPDVPMKDSGVEWLGEVPVHWEVSRLKHVTNQIIDCPHETPVYDPDGDFLVIRTADLEHGVLDPRLMYRLNVEQYRVRTRRSVLGCGDIVYGREGERWGHAALVPESGIYCLGQRMMQFIPSHVMCSEFLMWQLNSNNVYRQGSVDVVGATSPHVNVSTIKNYFIVVPARSEQSIIAQFLNEESTAFDELIHSANSTVELLYERRSALISAAVTGKIDVRGWQPPEDSIIQEVSQQEAV